MFARKSLFSIVLIFIFQATKMFAQYAAYVGEEVYLNAPSVIGTMDVASWSCSNIQTGVYVSGDKYGGKFSFNRYFAGKAEIVCRYGYTYYIGTQKKHEIGTAYYYITCKPSRAILNKSTCTLNLGESVELTYNNSSGYKLPGCFWKTSDKNVATVDGREYTYWVESVTVTAVSEGECTITFDGFSGEKASTCTIIVKAIPPTEITVSPNSLVLQEGKSGKFSYKLMPADAHSKVTWSSSNENVAKVSANGTVTAIGAGEAQITATTSNGLSAHGAVEVSPLPQQVSIGSKAEIALGYSLQLVPTMTPSNAISTYTWETSASDVVDVDPSGKVKAKRIGTATITVTTENDKKASCTITVKQPTDGMEYRNAEARIKTIKHLIKTSVNNLNQ